MASRCEVRLCAPDEATALSRAALAVAEVTRIEQKYSRYREDSVTARINRNAGGEAVAIDDETAALLDFAATLHAQSEGRFDLSSGVLRRAWDFTRGRLPAPGELSAVLLLVGWQNIEWDAKDRRLRLTVAGMEIDFGGIGKEYAADRAANVLREAGVRSGYVNLGGDVRGVGGRLDGAPWKIGIQHPRQPDRLLDTIDLFDGAIATSGDYERSFELDGRRYCHILDVRTGWPAAHWQSISVLAPACVAAGACSTIAMLLPVDDALAFLREQRVEYLAVAADGTMYRT